ncbi:MAG: amidohydrolase family protein [Proteobacteria bacterium]|nr:amidohydrolase family protein [Pseudomonadota bacterium]
MKFRYNRVIDAHTHPAGPSGPNPDWEWKNYKSQFPEMLNLAEPERPQTLAREMDKHGIDMAIGLCSIGMPSENERIIQIVQENRERFPACFVGFNVPLPMGHTLDGEQAAKEMEPFLKMPEVKGVGEWPLMIGAGMETWPELWAKYRPIMDVIAENDVAVLIHTGVDPYPIGHIRTKKDGTQAIGASRAMYFSNPVFIDDIATEYPEVPIIIGHIGVQGFYYFGSYADMALLVAARHENVYLETSSAPFEVVEKAVLDPAIGPERIVFGSDSPAPYGYYKYHGEDRVSYMKRPPERLADHMRYDLAVIERLPITDREKAMIRGENIAKVLGLTTSPHSSTPAFSPA